MKKENVLATEPISKLLFKFALPSVIAMIVGAFYNIVDQIYIICFYFNARQVFPRVWLKAA